MHIVLDGPSALTYWMCSLSTDGARYIEAPNPRLSDFSDRSCRSISDAINRAGGEQYGLSLLSRGHSERRLSGLITCSSWGAKPLPPHSICKIGDGVYAVSPELCVVRLATMLSRLELVRAATDLMGTYTHSFTDRQQLIDRSTPLLTRASLADYLQSATGVRGARETKRILNQLVERSASPRETSMDVCLQLCTRMGGEGLPPLKANEQVDLSKEALSLTRKKFLVADVTWVVGEKELYLEYNSNKHHDTEEELEFDFEKITAMRHDGKTVIPVSTRQFNDYAVFSTIVKGIRKTLGVRDKYGDRVAESRRATHARLLEIERRHRNLPNLSEQAVWRYLFGYLDLGSTDWST